MKKILVLATVLSIVMFLCFLASYEARPNGELIIDQCILVTCGDDTDNNPQTCDTPLSLEIETGATLKMQYFVNGSPGAGECNSPKRHCTSVRLRIYVDGVLEHTTDWLGWPDGPEYSGLDTGLLDLGPVSPGIHELSIKGEGRVEGCNYGQLTGWGGRLVVYTSSPGIEVSIDIKPGSYPNSINMGSQGVIPVAILSSETFDATQVDPETVILAGASVAVKGKGDKYMASEEDINEDGLVDLILKMDSENFDPDVEQVGNACLTGETYDGTAIEGCDEIRIVPPE